MPIEDFDLAEYSRWLRELGPHRTFDVERGNVPTQQNFFVAIYEGWRCLILEETPTNVFNGKGINGYLRELGRRYGKDLRGHELTAARTLVSLLNDEEVEIRSLQPGEKRTYTLGPNPIHTMSPGRSYFVGIPLFRV